MDNEQNMKGKALIRPPGPGSVREITVYVPEGERLRCGNCGKVCAEKLIGYVQIHCRRNFCETVNSFVSSRNAGKTQ